MADLNSATFTGRVTQAAETKEVGAKGTKLTTFQMENLTGFGPYEKRNVFTVKMWGQYGESLKDYLVAGRPVGAQGELVCNQFGGQQNWELMARSVTFIAADSGAGSDGDNSEEIPF